MNYILTNYFYINIKYFLLKEIINIYKKNSRKFFKIIKVSLSFKS